MSSELYKSKVAVYFQASLGRLPDEEELLNWSTALAENNGNVWKAGLVTYLFDLELVITTNEVASQDVVVSMLNNMFPDNSYSTELVNYYADKLDQGIIKVKGLANALINDLALMPKVDGTYGQPPNWSVKLSSLLSTDQKFGLENKVEEIMNQYAPVPVSEDVLPTDLKVEIPTFFLSGNVQKDVRNVEHVMSEGEYKINFDAGNASSTLKLDLSTMVLTTQGSEKSGKQYIYNFGSDDSIHIVPSQILSIKSEGEDVSVGMLSLASGSINTLYLIGVNNSGAIVNNVENFNMLSVGDISIL